MALATFDYGEYTYSVYQTLRGTWKIRFEGRSYRVFEKRSHPSCTVSLGDVYMIADNLMGDLVRAVR